ncbi:LuxR C-terminal-related transcriptional regulator [Yersinia sp. 2541 StPb PI]|uniref:LuxR C-terminal-related transcriptional regulator n=1 Tax=Yersinia sp. 2541 StPb PI TaxID=3117407 RepID=UPI003FA41F4E
MRDVIIYSGSDLIRFALRQIIEPIIISRQGMISDTIKVCTTLTEFESLIINSFNPVVIFDIDNISMFDQFRFFKLIDQTIKKKSLILYSKESGLSDDYFFSKKTDIVYLCKTTSVPEIETVLCGCLYCTDYSLSDSSTIYPRAKPKSLKLTKREKQILPCLLIGMSSEKISILFDVSKAAISAHKMNIFKKHQVTSLTALYYKLKRFTV